MNVKVATVEGSAENGIFLMSLCHGNIGKSNAAPSNGFAVPHFFSWHPGDL